jgi:GNAT superfamily N-acetyltransferase
MKMMRQLIYPTPELPPTLRDQIVSFLRLTWPKGFFEGNSTPDLLARQENHPLHFLLVDDSLLLSHAAVVWKYLEHTGEAYKTCGLSGVFTHPSFREQGYGRQMVEAGTAYIKHSDADIGLLWCAPSLKGFYARSGWVGLEKSRTLIGPKEAPIVYHLLLMMLFISKKGQRSQPSFESEPIYFGLETW